MAKVMTPSFYVRHIRTPHHQFMDKPFQHYRAELLYVKTAAPLQSAASESRMSLTRNLLGFADVNMLL